MSITDDRTPDAAADGAVFAPTRVETSQGHRILASIVLLALAGLIGIGALDRAAAPDFASIAIASQGPIPTRSSPAASIPASVPFRKLVGPAQYFELDIRPAGSDLFIHGDVFSIAVSRVTVRLQDSAGNVAATRSVDVPGGSTAFRIGAVPRFDVHFVYRGVSDAGRFVISVTAFDAGGHRLSISVLPVAGALDSV